MQILDSKFEIREVGSPHLQDLVVCLCSSELKDMSRRFWSETRENAVDSLTQLMYSCFL